MDWRSFLTAVFCETLACLAQEDFGDDMDHMEDPLDLESLTEGSKRSPQHQSNVKALEEEASYGEQTIMALQQLGLVLGCKGLSSNVVHEKFEECSKVSIVWRHFWPIPASSSAIRLCDQPLLNLPLLGHFLCLFVP